MAYINGNKPIVTNGLVYALDFGNSKSYVSGSNRAVSLAYNPPTTVVTGSTLYSTNTPTGVPYSNGIISLSGSQWVARTGSFSFLDPNSTFTVAYVIRPRASVSGSILGQQTTTSNFNAEISPTSSTVGFYYENQSYSRTFTGLSTASFQYVVYRYNSGSIDFFINGVPVTASAANNPIPNFQGLNNLFIGAQAGLTRFANSSLYNFLLYNRALTADEIYNNYLVFAGRFGMSAVPKPYSLDENVYQFVQASGITDSNTQTALSNFVSGLKVNGLWNKLIAIYPFVGSTTSSQALNLKEPGVYRAGYTGSWALSASGSTGNSTASLSVGELAPTTLYPGYNSSSAHLTYLSYDLPQSSSYLMGAVSYTSGSGGQIIITGSRTYHVFTSSATFSAITPGAVEILMVGGGGGAGGGNNVTTGGIGGGGGAGGVVYRTSLYITASNYIVTVGTGGASPLAGENGITGQNTAFGPLVAFGGGGGGIYANSVGSSGASGGGGGGGNANTVYVQGGDSILGQGNSGGRADIRTGGPTVAGGGGGASEIGGFGNNITAVAGNGGSGSYFPQYVILTVGSGSPAGWYAGGGAGGAYSGTGGKGGPGGGANGNVGATAASGSPNTGGGGGGNDYTFIGGPGGSGIVIISYPTAPTSSFALKITETSLTGSLNSPETSAITASGNIGLVTVSRKQAGILSLHKNTVSASFGTAGDFLPFPNLYLNAANNAGTASGITPSTIAFASVGAGLTTTEVATYHNLIGQLQANLKRQNTLLDNYSGAAAAYSLRRIGPSNYFGPAIRVRRDSDNTLRDIGFTSDGQLDTVGLLDFVGVTGSGFVQTWYDQSGNNYHATQSTSANQPLVLSSGSVVVQGIKPSLTFNTSSLSYNGAFLANSKYSIFLVTARNSPASFNYFLGGINSGTDTNLHTGFRSSNQFTLAQYNNDLDVTIPSYLEPVTQQYSLFNSNTGKSVNLNSTVLGSNTNTVNLISYAGSAIGSDRGTFYKGKLSEIFMYPSDQTSTRTAIESNLNTNYKIYGSATASFDPDYSAFITATGITQPTQSAALETLVSDLKSYGLWNKMKAIYPMITDKNNRFAYSQDLNTTWNAVSSSVTANSITAPDGTATAERLTETTSSIISYTVTNNGASAYTINGSDNPTLTLERGKTYQFNISATGHPFYIMTGSGAYTAGGQYDVGVTGQGTQSGTLTFVVPDAAPSTLAYVCQVHSSMGGTINVINNTDTHYIYQTIADGLVTGSEYVASIHGKFLNRPWIAIETNTGAKAWFNIQTGITGSLTGSNATITAVGSGWYRCALYFTSSVASGPQNIQYNLADADGNLSYAGVAGTGSYLWGAQFENGNVLGPYRATTTSGFTTGSMLDQMKFNLRNPVDTDAGFRITYSGSWNGGYSGVRGDGVTAYADTKLTPNTVMTFNNQHYTVYKTDIRDSGVDLGSTNTMGNGVFLRLITGSFLGAISSNNGVDPFTVSSKAGCYILNRTSSLRKQLYKNSPIPEVVTDSAPSDVQNYDIGSIFIGARNSTVSNLFSKTEIRLSTIGDGLTDYEAKALYWIVQKYQTTLGRQVY